MVLMDSQIHGFRDLEACTQLESGMEMGWLTLGHTFSNGLCNYISGKAGYMLLIYIYIYIYGFMGQVDPSSILIQIKKSIFL